MAITTRFLMSALVVLGTVAHSHSAVAPATGQVAMVQLRDACGRLPDFNGADCAYPAVPDAACTFMFAKKACDGSTCGVNGCICSVPYSCTTNALGICKMAAPTFEYDGFTVVCIADTRTSITNPDYEPPYLNEGPNFPAIWLWDSNTNVSGNLNNNGKGSFQTVGEIVLPCLP